MVEEAELLVMWVNRVAELRIEIDLTLRIAEVESAGGRLLFLPGGSSQNVARVVQVRLVV